MSGVSAQIEKELGGSGTGAGKKAGSNFVTSFKRMIAAAGISKAISTAFNEAADLQQNLGGTEAVFGEFAKTIQDEAKRAYKNMGASASDYMATANKMASLFKGSGLTQQRAMELTTEAMQRAADVASVMGVDTEAAFEAVTGAAKGNFTMMDNLGVKMNAAALEAYAMGEGLDFVWDKASEAEKAEVAMKMFFDRTSDYAGNFEKEANETLSGAFGSLKASAENLMGALVLGNDIAPAWDGFATSLGGVVNAFGVLFQQSAAMQAFNAWLKENEQLLTVLGIIFGTLAVAIGAYAIAANLATIATTLHTTAAAIATGVTTAFGVAVNFLTSPITLVILAIGALIAIIYLLVQNWDKVKEVAARVWEGIKEAWSAVSSWFSENVVEPIKNLFNDLFQPMINVGTDVVHGLWQGISDGYEWIKEKISGWVGDVLDFVKRLFDIHSPSKEFAWIGRMNVEGLAEGIVGNMGIVENAMSKLSRRTFGGYGAGLNVMHTLTGTLPTTQPVSAYNPTLDRLDNLTNHVDRLGEDMRNMRLYLNGRQLVGGIINDVDRELGYKRIAAQRGGS